jgi:hypothetical protein
MSGAISAHSEWEAQMEATSGPDCKLNLIKPGSGQAQTTAGGPCVG